MPDANFRKAHAGSAHMHFTWPAWDKTQSRLALFANLLCVADMARVIACEKTCGQTLKLFTPELEGASGTEVGAE